MTDRDTDLMRQALDALEQHDAPQRWPFAVKQDRRAVIAALRARLAEPVAVPDWLLDRARAFVPDGYALVPEDALRAWGKLDEVRAACVYPLAAAPKGGA